MLKAFLLALEQLPERELWRPLFDTLLWTAASLVLLWYGMAHELSRLADAWGAPGALAAVGGMILFGTAAWFLFVMIENVILFCYANTIIDAVEQRHYPNLPPVRSNTGALWASGIRLFVLTILLNVLVLPLYLIFPGANLVLFLLLNGYLLGRGYFDAIALRRWDSAMAQQVWRGNRTDFVINGVISVMLLTVPVLNLVAPIVGLAVAVHLMQRHASLILGSPWQSEATTLGTRD